jgi:hypothetical protein
MPLSYLFWGIYILSIILGFMVNYEAGQPVWLRRFSGYIVLWVLVGLLGYRVFGPAVR